ncbi:hypothetical protein B0I35DRAFT_18615 [Stachybotrys elegans]|uniref:Protein ECM13 n=1 Tax=Stachybotrys elegans TaxID=80388 RepID=A0A8K0WWA0_9HYPO|nr:hypothetical protein B0I35DRAFT_18615 [Stachybotrys elegans]
MSTITSTRPTASYGSDSLRQATLKKKMSITQTYYLAHKARAKLSREAAQPDHDLRLLVGHANLLDSLMLELAEAEREQERWFNQSVRGAASPKSQDRHVQWADRIEEEAVDEYDSDSSDSDSDEEYEEDVEMLHIPAPAPMAPLAAADDDVMEDDLEEDYAQLELVRTPSHSSSPPELVDHDSDSSDDESMPPSPPNASLPFPAKKESQQDKEAFYEDGFYLPPRTPTRLVSAISVY